MYEIEWKAVSNERISTVSFSVAKGQLVTIIGPSGAGKSSMLKLMNRLEDPDEGMIYYQDKALTDYPIKELRKKIGMAFQTAALFDGTVEDNLSYGPKLHGIEWSEKWGQELLDAVQLPKDFIHKPVEELSGGEQQRVALARTLANKPDVLLLDEVTSALDLRNVDLVEDLIKRLQQQGKTILMVTHDVEQAERLGDITLFLEKGKLVETGETAAFFTEPKTQEARRFLYRDEEGEE
ncbi:ABC transporter ATP-binding protein [Halalkalibacter nanhaiisediminis]|uniref:Phosphate ABC transporter ATP-binding protein, PhoT family (TC 3.A.1.7.1) n=1 Tax=Halalkalibacter nanhaiisediminis TaxID=688079 RepID=A0A562QM51_9BACI|nr:phosphate ABC transporter ATP-binding protein [Halalkalibacter nanhaiisediminis]TWI57831.1 phosphate ABC transporter ATP-binding protein, PhoT family (TC 3.A.1.7.1) [Halalkalibacter nanhaiisediminis]